jgi:hypothetical protein
MCQLLHAPWVVCFTLLMQVISDGRATKASDVYSFGVLMWEVYHGKTPW